MAGNTLTAKLNLNIQNFSDKLKEASRKMSNFAATTSQDYGKATAALKSHNLGLKDTARIVQGIMVSQAFYAAAQAIRSAVSAVWDFNVALDYMNVTYSALFGSTKVASDFMSVLQEHSVETIFDYQNLADASKKLLAYGIEYENLMFIMEGLTNLGAMSGDSAALDRIALALGQIYTKGKLSAEEMRQLANAYIPITEILQDKFGLTGDDLKRVGDLNLPAADVINAIVDYANENFGSVGDAAMFTITGLQNRIVDSLKVIGAEMLKPVTTAYKSFLAYISDGIDVLRDEFATDGIGGIFEYLVPDPSTQQTIRQFIANLRNLFMSLASVATVVGQVFGNIVSVAATAFNIVAPLIVGFVNVLASLLRAMMNNSTGAAILRIALVAAAGAFVILRVQAAAALVITAVTNAVTVLSKALLLLAAVIRNHPIIALLSLLGVTLVGISTASNKANGAISGLFDSISGATGGASSEDVLQRVEKELQDDAEAANQFNNRLEQAEQSTKDLEKALKGAGGAAKKTGGLLSFDEVYKLPDPSSSGGGSGSMMGDALDDLENLMEGLGGLGDALIPDIPDFSEFVKDFTDGLFGGLEQSIFDKLATTGLGALIGGGLGAIIGGLLGGPGGALLGAKIGALAGGIVGLLWEAFDGAISNTIAGATAGIGAAFGTSVVSAIAGAFSKGGLSAGFTAIGTALKTAGLKSILKGGVIGAAIGIFVDGLAHMLWNTLETKFESADAETAKVGQTIGSVIGAVIGGLLGGPAGVIIGSAIGTFAGGFVGLFWEPIAEYFDPKNNVLSAFFVETAYKIGEWATNTATELGGWLTDTAKGFSDWAVDTGEGLGEWFNDTFTGFSTWLNDTKSGFSTWWDETWQGFDDWLTDTVATFSDWDSITGDTLGTWWEETKTSFSDWAWNTYETVDGWVYDTIGSLAGWSFESLGEFTDWTADALVKFDEWRNDTFAVIDEWGSDALDSIGSFIQDSLIDLGEWMYDMLTDYDEFKEDARVAFEGVMIAIKKAIDDGLTKVGEAIGDFFGIDNLWTLIKEGIEGITVKLSTWWDGISSIFSGDIDVNPNVKVNAKANTSGVRTSMAGHASGGIFNREHIARFAEGNKAEMIVPLENASAMQPFVDAVSNGIVSSLAPIVTQVSAGNANNLPPMYVGTLIADDRGLRQLYKKFEVIQVQEEARRGLANP